MAKRVRSDGASAEKSEMPGFIKPQLATRPERGWTFYQIRLVRKLPRRAIRHKYQEDKREKPFDFLRMLVQVERKVRRELIDGFIAPAAQAAFDAIAVDALVLLGETERGCGSEQAMDHGRAVGLIHFQEISRC
jgi:hypothetical protein